MRGRRLALTVHIAVSIGWLGAAVAVLAMAAIGLASDDQRTVRAVYLVMEPTAWVALVPLAIVSLATGVVSSLLSVWGLLRHWWVVFKLLITVFATVILLMYMATFRAMAELAADPSVELDLVRNPSPLLHGLIAIAALLVATVLSVYKPRGLTPAGG
jgi:hypothetical protein